MIDVSMTYETWTEDEETDVHGYKWQSYPHTFRELVGLLVEHYHPSCWPVTDQTCPNVWFSSEDEVNHATGEMNRYSIHLSRPDDPRQVRYWIKAARTADRYRLAYRLSAS